MLFVLQVPVKLLTWLGAIVDTAAAGAFGHLLGWHPAAEAEEATSCMKRNAGDLTLVFDTQSLAFHDVMGPHDHKGSAEPGESGPWDLGMDHAALS